MIDSTRLMRDTGKLYALGRVFSKLYHRHWQPTIKCCLAITCPQKLHFGLFVLLTLFPNDSGD
jgi:hypothetical protein